MARADWIRYIRQNAPRYGIDPRAALAVASAEGLSGAVGDQGTSFGPFQLHVGGALPSGRGRAWAESPAGIDYALRQIASVARGQTGRQAVANIVRRFERPADPTGEIERAMGAYGGFGGSVGSAVAAAVVPGAPGRAGTPGTPPRQVAVPTLRSTTQRIFDPATLSQGIFAALASGGTPDIGSLVGQSYRNETIQLPDTKLVTIPGTPGTKGRPGTPARRVAVPADAIKTKAGWYSPTTGKVIGTPGAGTHTLGNWESDRAYDVAVPVGTPIYAPFSGMIGQQFGSLGASPSSRFGGLRLHVVGPQNEWYGAHLSRFAPGIRPGMAVQPGQLLGYSGSASGVAHLHEALKYGDPSRLLGRA